jgi:hypothetical protein
MIISSSHKYKEERTMDTQTDQYDDKHMHIRSYALKVLMNEFGGSEHSNRSIYECVEDWVSKGNVNASGIVKYYSAYYKNRTYEI